MTHMHLVHRSGTATRCTRSAAALAAVFTAGLTLGFGAGVPFLSAQTTAPAAAISAPAVLSGAATGFTAASTNWLAPSYSSSTVSSSSASDAPVLEADLPEAPLPQPGVPMPQIVPLKPEARTPGGQPVAPLHAKYIPAGWRAQPLGAHGKIAVGATDLYSFENFGAIFLSAGYEHLLNGEPNYGVDKGAFGERLGAAALREATQGVFTDMVFSPVLHEDPRYYQEGDSYSVVHRTLYAITRPLITRTDTGRRTVNGALLLGYAASAALTPAYYPSGNRNFHDAASVYGGAIGGAALGFFVSEFSDDVLAALHLKHNR